MPDRADHLARTLFSRLDRLHAISAEDGRGEPDRAQRIAVIEKILAVDLGVTDPTTLATIEAAAPDRTTARQSPDRELASFAAFLRRRLANELELTQPQSR